MKKVLAVASRPGGGVQVGPVVRRLRSDGRASVVAVALGAVQDIWRGLGIEYKNPEIYGTRSTERFYAEAMLDAERPDIVIAGTAYYPSADGWAVKVARERSIPNITLAEEDADYSVDLGPAAEHAADVITITDRPCEDNLRGYLTSVGAGDVTVILTGNPSTDAIVEYAAAFGSKEIEEAKRELDAEGKVLVSHFSGPISTDPNNLAEAFGYNELDSFRAIMKAVDEEYGDHGIVAVKFHPRQRPERLHAVAREFEGSAARHIFLSRDYSSIKLALMADANTSIGCSTIATEAAFAGRRTIIVEPGSPPEKEREPTVLSGINPAIYRMEDVAENLRKLVEDEVPVTADEIMQKMGAPVGGATERIVDLIYERI